MVWDVPAGAFVDEHEPAPAMRVAVHSTVAPAVKATVPTGVPPLPVTVVPYDTEVPYVVDEGVAVAVVTDGVVPPAVTVISTGAPAADV